MIVRRVLPEPGDAIEIGTDDARPRLDALYSVDDPAFLRINLVADAAGSAAGSDGTSESLSSRADRAILGAIRRASDVVLVGAQSVRAEGYQLPRTVPLAVADDFPQGLGLTEAVSPLRIRGMTAMLARIKRQVREKIAA